ncbi:MAG: hypothetical protein J6Q55_03300 [Clostridia bacterium]|nr:hypothetical protein [Clostridia bacterium]
MRKIAEKVALVAQICLAVIFVIVALLYVLGVIPQATWQEHAVIFVVLAVFAVLFVATSIYLIYMNFSELQNLKRILLYADSKSATTTTLGVVNKIARGCSDKIEGVHIKRTKIRADEKKGYVAMFTVEISAQSVSPSLEQLRCLIEDTFRETLGLVFNTITFEVAKIKQPKADVKKAQKRAQAIADGASEVQDIYQNPTGEKPTDISLPIPADTPTDVATDENDTLDEDPIDTDVAAAQTDVEIDQTNVVEPVDEIVEPTETTDESVLDEETDNTDNETVD